MSQMAMLIRGAFMLGLVAAGALYVLLVATVYRIQGPGYHLYLTLRDPIRSVERLLVWIGVKLAAVVVAAGQATLHVLYDASADVGTWVVSKSGAQVQARVRSRFM